MSPNGDENVYRSSGITDAENIKFFGRFLLFLNYYSRSECGARASCACMRDREREREKETASVWIRNMRVMAFIYLCCTNYTHFVCAGRWPPAAGMCFVSEFNLFETHKKSHITLHIHYVVQLLDRSVRPWFNYILIKIWSNLANAWRSIVAASCTRLHMTEI